MQGNEPTWSSLVIAAWKPKNGVRSFYRWRLRVEDGQVTKFNFDQVTIFESLAEKGLLTLFQSDVNLILLNFMSRLTDDAHIMVIMDWEFDMYTYHLQ